VKRGVSLDQANSEITTFAKHFAETYPDTDKSFNTSQVEPLLSTYTPLPLRGTLLTMLGFCVGVLLIGCVNVMNMQFARATLRARELAIRSSLGATRARLIVQMLTENLVVAFIGTAIGVGLAYYCTNLLATTTRNLDNPIPSWISFDIDGGVLAFTVGAMLLAAVISGLPPAWSHPHFMNRWGIPLEQPDYVGDGESAGPGTQPPATFPGQTADPLTGFFEGGVPAESKKQKYDPNNPDAAIITYPFPIAAVLLKPVSSLFLPASVIESPWKTMTSSLSIMIFFLLFSPANAADTNCGILNAVTLASEAFFKKFLLDVCLCCISYSFKC